MPNGRRRLPPCDGMRLDRGSSVQLVGGGVEGKGGLGGEHGKRRRAEQSVNSHVSSRPLGVDRIPKLGAAYKLRAKNSSRARLARPAQTAQRVQKSSPVGMKRMSRLSIEELTERFPFFRSAFVFADPLSIALHRSNALAKEIAAAEGGVPPALDRCQTFRHSRRGRLPGRLRRFRHQTDQLSVIGRASDQTGHRRPSRAFDHRAGRSPQHGVARYRALPRLRRPRPHFGWSRIPILPSFRQLSTWGRKQAIRTIHRRKARSFTPTPATFFAAAGTGARTCGTTASLEPAARRPPSSRTASATSRPQRLNRTSETLGDDAYLTRLLTLF